MTEFEQILTRLDAIERRLDDIERHVDAIAAALSLTPDRPVPIKEARDFDNAVVAEWLQDYLETAAIRPAWAAEHGQPVWVAPDAGDDPRLLGLVAISAHEFSGWCTEHRLPVQSEHLVSRLVAIGCERMRIPVVMDGGRCFPRLYVVPEHIFPRD